MFPSDEVPNFNMATLTLPGWESNYKKVFWASLAWSSTTNRTAKSRNPRSAARIVPSCCWPYADLFWNPEVAQGKMPSLQIYKSNKNPQSMWPLASRSSSTSPQCPSLMAALQIHGGSMDQSPSLLSFVVHVLGFVESMAEVCLFLHVHIACSWMIPNHEQWEVVSSNQQLFTPSIFFSVVMLPFYRSDQAQGWHGHSGTFHREWATRTPFCDPAKLTRKGTAWACRTAWAACQARPCDWRGDTACSRAPLWASTQRIHAVIQVTTKTSARVLDLQVTRQRS